MTCRGMDSARSLVCGKKMLAADPLSPVSCEVVPSMDQTRLFSTSRRCSIKLRSWEFGGQVGGTCQSNIHMDGRTQGFPVEYCPKHDTAPASLPCSHSGSWCHVFPCSQMKKVEGGASDIFVQHIP
ncbi:hypothetical protein QTP86_018909 [Hemibagrus guttatus]|nr:hypothetical protein QTP86_018909 [Hemibagrus guttatus]